MIETNSKFALNALLQQKTRDAIGILTKKVYEKLKEFIQKDIYDTYTPNASNIYHYSRTYEFRDVAWEQNFFDMAGDIVGEISYNWQAMSYNPSAYQHGSYADGDRRAKLASILNRGFEDWSGWDFGRHNGAEGYSSYPKPFFDDTLEWLGQNWNKLVKESFKEVGIKLK